MAILSDNITIADEDRRDYDMLGGAVYELVTYGPFVVFKHIKSVITKNNAEYILEKQKKASRFSTHKIEKILKHNFYQCKGVKPNFRNPQSFDEKINWLMLYDATPLKTRLVDKYLVRKYIEEKIGENYLVPLLGVWDRFDDIDFESLPHRFVLKLNNGSGMNIVVKNKDNLNITEAKNKFEFWMKTNFAYMGFEMQYRDVPQKIIAEQYIEQIDGNLFDYKMHCFNGKMKICQLIGDRNMIDHTAKQAFFDADWNRLNESEGTYPDYNSTPSKPDNWEEMKLVAEKLAVGFNYVRVDLYSIEGQIYFGEFTFTPLVGLHPNFRPKEADLRWGSLIILPEPYELPGLEPVHKNS